MLNKNKKYRLITRSDFDGLVCAILLKELGVIEEIKFVHPKDMQDGKIEVTPDDITTNLPYVKGVAMAFDHHLSETIRNKELEKVYVIDPNAPSAARVLYNYFGGKEQFKNISEEMMEAVDKADSARFTKEDVLYPKNWELLNFIMDPRTGLGRFKEFKISNYQLMMDLINYCRNHTIKEILEVPDVKERVILYGKYKDQFNEQLITSSKVYRNLVLVDLREQDIIYPGNRFTIYALFPLCNISIHALWGLNKQNTVFAVGKSIFKRTSKTNIGELMYKYGGGGHANAGTCQVENARAPMVLKELMEKINLDG